MMEFETSLTHRSGKARYRITREKPGVYHARLLGLEAPDHVSLPKEITLIRGFKRWTGSEDDEVLINTLGLLIEVHLINNRNAEKGEG